MSLSRAERDLLAGLQEDGFPLGLLANGLDQARSLQSTALSLLRQGLIRVYGHPDVPTVVPPEEVDTLLRSMKRQALEGSTPLHEPPPDLPPAEAEKVLRSIENWTSRFAPFWYVSTTSEGDALLAADR